MEYKTCNKCGQSKLKNEDNFNKHPTTKDGWLNQCRGCKAAYRKSRILRESKHRKISRMRLKAETFAAYGGRCTCCKEDRLPFLTIEHVNGRDGSQFRSHKEFARLKKLGYPKDNITILCFNCNCAKGAYGSCPHTWDECEIKKHTEIRLVKKIEHRHCKKCGKQIWIKAKTDFCAICNGKKRNYSLDEILRNVEELGYRGTGKKYGVSDNAIRKWIKRLKKQASSLIGKTPVL